jgi:hypothetical protein
MPGLSISYIYIDVQNSLSVFNHSLGSRYSSLEMLFSTTATTLYLTLASLVTSSPILHVRDDSTSASDPRAIFKPDTLLLIDTLTEAITLPGGIIAYTSPKGDGVLTFGNRSVAGEPVTPDVSPCNLFRQSSTRSTPSPRNVKEVS